MKAATISRTFAKRQRFIWFLLFGCMHLARGQSADDVHIVPRQKQTGTNAIADTVSLKATSPHLSGSAFHINVDLVLVPVSVNDSMNRPVMTLRRENFALFDENKPQEIRYFSHEDAPASVALLLDVSKSMTDKIESERAAVIKFFESANPED